MHVGPLGGRHLASICKNYMDNRFVSQIINFRRIRCGSIGATSIYENKTANAMLNGFRKNWNEKTNKTTRRSPVRNCIYIRLSRFVSDPIKFIWSYLIFPSSFFRLDWRWAKTRKHRAFSAFEHWKLSIIFFFLSFNICILFSCRELLFSSFGFETI